MQPTPQHNFSLALKFVTWTKPIFMVVYYKIFWVDSSLYGPPLKSMGFLGAGINSQRASGRAGTQVWSVPGGAFYINQTFQSSGFIWHIRWQAFNEQMQTSCHGGKTYFEMGGK